MHAQSLAESLVDLRALVTFSNNGKGCLADHTFVSPSSYPGYFYLMRRQVYFEMRTGNSLVMALQGSFRSVLIASTPRHVHDSGFKHSNHDSNHDPHASVRCSDVVAKFGCAC